MYVTGRPGNRTEISPKDPNYLPAPPAHEENKSASPARPRSCPFAAAVNSLMSVSFWENTRQAAA